MTSEPINLSALRLHARTRRYDERGTPLEGCVLDPHELLALIDAVEAARALVEHWAQQGPTRRTLDLNPNSLRGREDALSEALARFTP